MLRVRRSWLERQAANRKIPFTMLGGSYRFTSAHLAQIVEIFESKPAQTHGQKPVTRQASGVKSRQTETKPISAPLLRPRPRSQSRSRLRAA